MQKILLVVFLLNLTLVSLAPSCLCPDSAESPPENVEIPSFDKNLFPKLIFDGIDFGKSTYFMSRLFLEKELVAEKGSGIFQANCPAGYSTFSFDELRDIFNQIPTNERYGIFTDPNILGLDPKKQYALETRATAGKYNLLYFSEQNKHVGYMTFSESELNDQIYCKCYKKLGNSIFSITSDGSAVKGKTNSYNVFPYIYDKLLWKFNNTLYDAVTFTKKFPETGCYTLEAWFVFENKTNYTCTPVYINNPFYLNVDSDLKFEDIHTINTNVEPVTNRILFFNPSTAVVASKVSEIGFWVAYSSRSDYQIHILDYDSKFNLIEDKPLNIFGLVLDIAGTPWGFAIIIGSKNQYNEFIYGFYSDFTPRFYKVIFNNGNAPSILKEQIAFYLSENSELAYGLDAMYEAENAKMVYANGRFGIVFTHYNNFDEGNSQNGHTGETFILLDENGDDIKWGVTWGSSHSLIQSLLFDGKRFIFASLGDAFPQNINVHYHYIDYESSGTDFYTGRKIRIDYGNKNIYDGSMKGTQTGNSSGRLGGLLFNGEKYAVVYSVKDVEGEGQDTEFGIITFTLGSTFNSFEYDKHKVGKVDASQLVQIRAGKYGKNILVMYMYSKTPLEEDYPPYYSVNINVESHFILLSFSGDVIAGPFTTEEFKMNLSDDLTELENGAVVWTSFDNTGKLSVNYLPPLID